MSYLYAVTAQKSTAVNFSIVCQFTSSNEKNLILAKGNHIEVYLIKEDGLSLLTDISLFGSVKSLEYYRPALTNQDVLFVLTERKKVAVLSYDQTQRKVITKSMGNVKDRIGRDAEMGQRGFIDPEGRLIGMILYDGLLKVIPVDGSGLKEPFNLQLEETRIIDIKFLHGSIRPTLCILYEDNRRSRHVKTSSIDLREKEFIPGTWQQNNVDFSASLLITVPSPLNGVIVIGLTTITYISGTGVIQTVEISPTQVCSYSKIDALGTRYLLGDHRGQLMVLALHTEQGKVISITTDIIGVTSFAETISYLDHGVVFIGSTFGDSQLIKLHAHDSSNGAIEVLDTYTNIGPILDMCLVDNNAAGGQKQLVTCSGAYKDGSLRIIRSGIGIHEQASLEISGIKGIWSLRTSETAEYDKYLVQSFTTETRILAIEGEELGEVEINGFESNLPTIYCSNVANGMFVQVTSLSVRLVDCATYQLYHEFTTNKNITVATGNLTQLILSVSGGQVIYLELDTTKRSYSTVSSVTLDQDVACVSFYGALLGKRGNKQHQGTSSSNAMDVEENDQNNSDHLSQISNLVAVGMWTDNTVRLLTLPTLQEVVRTQLNTDTQARDILLISFDKKMVLLVGMGDGSLISYHIELSGGLPTITNRRKGVLGTHPIKFTPFFTGTSSSKGGSRDYDGGSSDGDELCVFAACDRPTVIYMRNHKLLFSIMNVKTNEVSEMTQFHSELFPDCLVLCSENQLFIGIVEDIQKMHIQTIPLGEAPRRITHNAAANVYAVCSEKTVVTEKGEESIARILFFDDGNFQLISSFELDYLEQGISITTCQLEGCPRPLIIVGTAQVVNDEAEPSKGRVLVFDILSSHNEEKKVNLLTEKETKSGVYSLVGVSGKLAAGIGSKIQIYKLIMKDENTMSNYTIQTELQNECHHQGHIMTLYLKAHGDYIIVGDLVRSISLLRYRKTESTIEEIARDFNSNYMRAVEIMDDMDDHYLGCDDHANLFCLRRQGGSSAINGENTAVSEEEQMKLEVRGEYHIGDYVNVFTRGSLVIQPIETDTAHTTANSSSSANASDVLVTDIFDSNYKSVTGYPSDKYSVMYGTISGGLGNLFALTESSFKFFHAIEKAMKSIVTPIGGFPHDEWRNFQNAMRSSAQRNIIDGDLVETLLDLNKDQLEIICREVNEELTSYLSSFSSPSNNATTTASGGTGEGGSGAVGNNKLISNLVSSRVNLTVEDIFRRVEDIARLH